MSQPNTYQMEAEMEENTTCTKCQELLPNNPELWRTLETPRVRNSLSRRDNTTYICNLCGTTEGLADYYGITELEARQQAIDLRIDTNKAVIEGKIGL